MNEWQDWGLLLAVVVGFGKLQWTLSRLVSLAEQSSAAQEQLAGRVDLHATRISDHGARLADHGARLYVLERRPPPEH